MLDPVYENKAIQDAYLAAIGALLIPLQKAIVDKLPEAEAKARFIEGCEVAWKAREWALSCIGTVSGGFRSIPEEEEHGKPRRIGHRD